jgi:branched-chain amino acid transport system ATP-binding protein
MLEVTNLSVAYGAVAALNDITFKIGTGECVALLGSNGAGKTTTLKTISGLLKPSHGSIRFEGREIGGLPAHMVVRQGVVQIPEGRRIFPELLVRENLEIGAYARNKPAAEDFDRIFQMFPILKQRLTQRGGTLSGGEQQMLAFGRALMARPKLLMLDEPSLGLAPMIVELLFNAIRSIKAETTILLVEQNVHIALEIVDRAYVLREGRLAREGAAAELAQDSWIREAYLGVKTA